MRDVRTDFPLLRRQPDGKRIVYLDSAATALKPQTVVDAVSHFYTSQTAAVHRAVHRLAEEATEAYENARVRIAHFFHVAPQEVVFTRGATSAINLVRRGFPHLRRTAATAMEHHSNLLPWAFHDGGTIIAVDAEGNVDLRQLDEALERGLELLALTHLSNVLGCQPDVAEIVARAHAAGAMVLLDAAQSAAHMPVQPRKLDVDFMTVSGHKMLGPSGVGLLYGKAELLDRMQPDQLGGHIVDQVHLSGYELQKPPHRFEAGTPPIEGVLGWGAGVDYLEDLGMEQVALHQQDLVRYAHERLQRIPHVRIVGPSDPAHRQALLSFNVDGLEAHGVARMLSQRFNV